MPDILGRPGALCLDVLKRHTMPEGPGGAAPPEIVESFVLVILKEHTKITNAS